MTFNKNPCPFVLTGALVAVLTGCSGQTAEVGPNGCAIFSGDPLLDREGLENLVGAFEIAVAATSGEQTGEVTQGIMTLRGNLDNLRLMSDGAGGFMDHVAVPYYGTSDIDMAAVGADPLGGATSGTPQRPGVLVVQTNSVSGDPQSVVIRLGADANERDAVRFDGSYTVLRVHYVTRDSLAGEWVSGQLHEVARGCWKAVRMLR